MPLNVAMRVCKESSSHEGLCCCWLVAAPAGCNQNKQQGWYEADYGLLIIKHKSSSTDDFDVCCLPQFLMRTRCAHAELAGTNV